MNARGILIQLLTTHRLPLADEKQLQLAISEVLSNDGWQHRREVRLAPHDIVDFMVLMGRSALPESGIAIEVKIKGSRRAIFRQLERYAAHDAVEEIILATNVPMGLPEEINGKPVSIAALGRGWL